MVSKKVLGALAASVFAFSMGAAQAQFTGGTQPQVTSVAQVINQARDNQYVSVQGYLTQKVGNEEYIVSFPWLDKSCGFSGISSLLAIVCR